MADKVTKASVNYSRGMGNTRCRNCVHFEKPNACELVSSDGPPTPGRIDPEYWCERFKMRHPHSIAGNG